MFLKIRYTLLMLALFAGKVAAQDSTPIELVRGVSEDLAKQRATAISKVAYDLHFVIPKDQASPIQSEAIIRFDLQSPDVPVVLDFSAPAELLQTIKVNRKNADIVATEGHIVLPKSLLKKGGNQVAIHFLAGENALNRSPEFLYTLFVPDRAASAFPCFDQPDMKAKFRLKLDVPSQWVAVSNTPVSSQKCANSQCAYQFEATAPISTYLFSFVAGVFKKETQTIAGREMNMYHRETDSLTLNRNKDAIFRLHASSMQWLEAYTGIPMPFQKFDFVLIPSFQFGGMEHVGAILYKASSLMLEASATQNQQLQRASLIAHETSHMWFGNLVTMRWFNDVWLKEVFANFMAAKIVNPNFPDVNHELRFLLSHHPSAYSEDRTAGAHPIQQKLENLRDAGTLYGRIIYQKAPIVMQQLELMMGKEAFQRGIREYLERFSYGNAVWDDLIAILDSQTEVDLKTWSEVWVKEPGMPMISVHVDVQNGKIAHMEIRQERHTAQGNFWPQQLQAVLGWEDSLAALPVALAGKSTTVEAAVGLPAPSFVLADGTGLGYGFFVLDPQSRQYLLKNISNIKNPVVRGVAWLALYEEMLNGRIKASALMETVMAALPVEYEPLNTQNILGYLHDVYWRFYHPEQRLEMAPRLEEELWRVMYKAMGQSAKSAYFRTYRDIALTPEAAESLKNIWEKKLQIDGLNLSEQDYTALACELALRGIPEGDSILQTQISRISNPDQKRRMEFISPSLSVNPEVRNAFFEELRKPENRHYEPWVLEALEYLHHPLRAGASEKYIRPSLEMLEEIQQTGDIFFPKRWLLATFSGHQSKSAAEEVKAFLRERPDYHFRLKNKILQAADMLFKASELNNL